MTCKVPGGAQVHFLNSGVIVEAVDLSTQSEKTRYAVARLTTTEEAGKVIRKNAIEAEPVHVVIGGHVQNRYLFPKDTLRIRREDAEFQLYDARKVLERGVLSQYWGEASLKTIADYIFENRDDPEGALTDIRPVSDELANTVRQDELEQLVETIHGDDANAARNGWKGAINSAVNMGMKFGHWLLNDLNTGYSVDPILKGIELDEVSPNDALSIIEEEFGFSSWVDADGVLWLGLTGSVPKNYHAVSGTRGDKSYVMKEYNVTEGAYNVSVVKVTGQTFWYGGGFQPSEELFPMAEAAAVDPSTGETANGKIVSIGKRSVRDLAALEEIAYNTLIQSNLNYWNGSIIFNGVASTQQERLATIAVGDVVLVSDNIERCASNGATGGTYVITSVQHKFSPSRGWSINCEVGQIPDELESMAVYYNAEKDIAYTSRDDYMNPDEDQ